jgi:hypothetical protein
MMEQVLFLGVRMRKMHKYSEKQNKMIFITKIIANIAIRHEYLFAFRH